MNKNKEAKICYKNAMDLDPKDRFTKNYYINISIELNEYQDAIEALNTLLLEDLFDQKTHLQKLKVIFFFPSF